MNKLKSIIIFIHFTVFSVTLQSQSYDYLRSTTNTGSGITTDNSKAWTDLTSITIDVTNVSKVLVSASLNMRPDGSSIQGREGNYRIYRSDDITDNSGVIKRQMVRNSESGVESWGIGTLIHIFDTSSLTGNKTFVLEHSNQGQTGTGRNVYTNARLTGVALTTTLNQYELSNDVKRVSNDVSVTSATFEPVAGTTTNSLSLPIQGDIYVAASINSRANGNNNVGEYILEYSSNGGVNWSTLGKPVQRTMINTYDDGIISLVALLQNQPIGSDYQFRLAHRRVSGSNTIVTRNVNLVAIALAHSGNSYFPTFYSEIGGSGVHITGVSTPAEEVTSASITSSANINDNGIQKPALFVNAQFLVGASGLDVSVNPNQRMRARNQLFLDDGTTTISDTEYFRYIPDNDNFGSGGINGLAIDLNENTNYTVSMMHDVAYVSNPDATEDETLTTSEVILTGFQTFDKPSVPLSIEDELLKQQLTIYSTNTQTIILKSEKPLNVHIELYNMLGQRILEIDEKGLTEKLIKGISQRGVLLIKISTENASFSKKLIL